MLVWKARKRREILPVGKIEKTNLSEPKEGVSLQRNSFPDCVRNVAFPPHQRFLNRRLQLVLVLCASLSYLVEAAFEGSAS